MNDNLKTFTIVTEKGFKHHVLATDPEDAVESFYKAVKSLVGHEWKICGCFNDGQEKHLDRTKVIRPYRILDSSGKTVKTLSMAELKEIEKIQK